MRLGDSFLSTSQGPPGSQGGIPRIPRIPAECRRVNLGCLRVGRWRGTLGDARGRAPVSSSLRLLRLFHSTLIEEATVAWTLFLGSSVFLPWAPTSDFRLPTVPRSENERLNVNPRGGPTVVRRKKQHLEPTPTQHPHRARTRPSSTPSNRQGKPTHSTP